jgi:hypothetical protein
VSGYNSRRETRDPRVHGGGRSSGTNDLNEAQRLNGLNVLNPHSGVYNARTLV